MSYSEAHKVEYSECDENQRLKLTAMVDLLMQVSEHQLASAGAGTAALMKRGWGWVVTQYHFTIKRLPRPLEKIILSTNAKGYNRFLAYRDFAISDELGNTLVSVSSQWVMFDIKNRVMLPIDLDLMKQLSAPLLVHMPRFPRMRPLPKYDQQRKYRVRFDDLDTNHHLTNSHYFNWFIDCLPRDFLHDYVVTEIDIKFNQEVKYGEKPLTQLTVNKSDKIMTYHAIMDKDGIAETLCELKWRKV